MGIVQMHRDFFGEVIHRAEHAQMPVHNILNGRGYQEILLTQAQRFAFGVVVGGVEDFGNDLCHRVLLHRAHIVALIKQGHIERGRFRLPQAQNGNALAVFSLALAVELLPPFSEEVKFGIIVYEDFDFLAGSV